MKEEEMRDKYLQYKMLEEQSTQIQAQVQKIAEQLFEIEYVKQSLDEYKRVKKDKEMLSPISSGIFVKSKVSDVDNFYVNVGSSIVIKKNIEETKKLMSTQETELRAAQEKLLANLESVNQGLHLIEAEIVKQNVQVSKGKTKKSS